ncbi:MAG: thioredoxin family protein [Candidatus Marinimicrobia bacterium]|nr:thioredoxin family protein [Candidatus Neomarinimicrobiota bacterium]MCF7839864.1 thioredoxin family protein [Candidatus Neomarinimicrobiota bacterium]MCF7903451.1 thioredoxin family protein [Candidatus Neomarinimicrobiota bacterium]
MLHIQVVGPGCPNCQKLESLCREVVHEQGWKAQIEKVSDFNQIIDLGVFITPGLIVNNDVVSSGKIPTKATLKNWLADRITQND